ncbi:GNAT family N-acetyltransferase [Parasphingopyxis sp.]|uniref:GNAT family N-acetyltransferase n=1 Tax=Parasphingopyxis sp. TaxID=1920299 RepID=UPI002627FFF3|nr:GNAT family N-acetyltransferase [Parasphingopyxis sp.]
MKSDCEIRAATGADIPAIKAIADATELFPSDMLDAMIAGYLDGDAADIWFVAAQDGQTVAFGFCEPERMTEGTWNLLAIGVVPEHQGNGIGGAMMAYLEEKLAAAGARVLIVETMGTPELAATRTFYAKNGYAEEARIREFYEAGADKVVFWKHF